MSLIFGPDISNYNTFTTADVTALTAFGAKICMVRASLESAALSASTRQQLSLLKPSGIITTSYSWCYGQDDPISTVDSTISLIDGLATTNIIVFDVEDIQNFIQKNFNLGKNVLLPGKFMDVDPRKVSLLGISPAEAVAWLKAAGQECITKGYEPWIYSNEGAWGPIAGNSTAFASWKWNVANWDGVADPSVIIPVGGKTTAEAKQYASAQQGIFIGGVAYDMDVWDTNAIIGIPTPPPPPVGASEPEADAINAALQARFALQRSGITLMQQGLDQLMAAASVNTPAASDRKLRADELLEALANHAPHSVIKDLIMGTKSLPIGPDQIVRRN